MRCVSCNRMLTDTERMAVKYIVDEDNPEVFVRTDIQEDMCYRCKTKMRDSGSILNRSYAHEDLTEGLSAPSTMSDYL